MSIYHHQRLHWGCICNFLAFLYSLFHPYSIFQQNYIFIPSLCCFLLFLKSLFSTFFIFFSASVLSLFLVAIHILSPFICGLLHPSFASVKVNKLGLQPSLLINSHQRNERKWRNNSTNKNIAKLVLLTLKESMSWLRPHIPAASTAN